MTEQPTLHTDRLVLRPFVDADAGQVQLLAGDRAVAAMTLHIPHPYEDGMAQAWIATHELAFRNGEQATFAVVLRDEDVLIGAVGLRIVAEGQRAELGYWIGRPWWGRGYCTEAARAAVRYGFEGLRLNRISASHFSGNPASGRVMQKLGMQREGCQRQHIRKGDRYVDLICYGILRGEHEAQLGD